MDRHITHVCHLRHFSCHFCYFSVQIGSPGEPVKEFLEEWTTEPLEEIACSIIPSSTKVFLNGVWVGIHRNPIELVRTLRSLRRQVSVFSAEVFPCFWLFVACGDCWFADGVTLE